MNAGLRPRWVVLALATALAASCGKDLFPITRDVAPGDAASDAALDSADAPSEAAGDAPGDADIDADAAGDGSPDAPVDGASDGGADAPVDGASDGGADAAGDASIDGASDAAADAPADAFDGGDGGALAYRIEVQYSGQFADLFGAGSSILTDELESWVDVATQVAVCQVYFSGTNTAPTAGCPQCWFGWSVDLTNASVSGSGCSALGYASGSASRRGTTLEYGFEVVTPGPVSIGNLWFHAPGGWLNVGSFNVGGDPGVSADYSGTALWPVALLP